MGKRIVGGPLGGPGAPGVATQEWDPMPFALCANAHERERFVTAEP